jgi:hypothetical protein
VPPFFHLPRYHTLPLQLGQGPSAFQVVASVSGLVVGLFKMAYMRISPDVKYGPAVLFRKVALAVHRNGNYKNQIVNKNFYNDLNSS